MRIVSNSARTKVKPFIQPTYNRQSRLLNGQLITTADIPTPSGMCFTEEDLKKICKTFPAAGLYGPFGTRSFFPDLSFYLTDAALFTRRIFMHGLELRADIEVTRTPQGNFLHSLLDSGTPVNFYKAGKSFRHPNGYVKDYDFVCIYASVD